MGILLASRIRLISAKQFDFKMCWTRDQFGDILDRNCPSLYPLKRNMETKGELRILCYINWIGLDQPSTVPAKWFVIRFTLGAKKN